MVAALDWAQLIPDCPTDWALIPLDGNKTPIDPEDGSPHPCWQRYPCNLNDLAQLNGVVRAIGLALGPASSGVLAVDFDGNNAAQAFAETYGRPDTDLPQTIAVTSGRPNRCQRFFQVDSDWWPHLRGRRVWHDTNGQTCLELRWDGHQSVIAGEHPDTAGYAWLPGCSPADLKLAPAPDWLLKPLVRTEDDLPPVEPSSKDASRAQKMLAFIDPSTRSDYTSWLEVGMALHHTDPALLTDWVEWSRTMPTFDEAECLAKWQSFGTTSASSLTIRSLHYWAKQGGYQEPPSATSSTDDQSADQLLLAAWGTGWLQTPKGPPQPTPLNAGAALALFRKRLKPGSARLNAVTGLVEINGASLDETDLSTLYAEAQAKGWAISKEACSDAILRFARQHRYDPIQEYLNFVADSPDITPVDINTLSSTYLNTTCSDFDLYMKIAVLGAVQRRFEPGSQFDTVVTLDGDGRIGKSGVWIALASPDWHSSSDAESEKDFLLILHRTWLYEQAELDYLASKRQVGQLKNLITTRKDSVRAPYGKGIEQRDRAGIMVGTVNGPFLQGDEALRGRFLVIRCPQSFKRGERIDVQRITADRDRIWKAAVLAYRNGEQSFLTPQQLAAASERNLSGSEHDHPWRSPIQNWLNQPINTIGPHTTDAILIGAGLRTLDRINRADQMELSKAMELIGGWAKDREPSRHNGSKARFWRRAE